MKQIREKEGGWKRAIALSLFIFGVLFGYAFVRYIVIKGVALANVPLFILNKALAILAVALIGLSFIIGPLARLWPQTFTQRLYLRKYFGLLGFGVAALHGLMSLLMFSPAYYPKFFDAATGKLNAFGESSMLFGAVSLFIFAIVALTSLPSVEQKMRKQDWLAVQRLGYIAFLLVLLHVAVMGYAGWLTPSDWPGGLPPISMLAAIIIAVVLLLRVIVMLLPRK